MSEAEQESADHVELQDVSKHYGGVLALDCVSLKLKPGSVHALIGENGAGKSTLGKIIAGAIVPDGGRMAIGGSAVAFRTPKEALDRGVALIAQEPSVVPRLSIAENVLLGSEPRRAGFVNRRALNRRYRELAADAGFDLPATMPAGRLRTAEQQQVEILRALARDATVIVMDEPSAALSGPDTERLHEIVRELVARGKTILLISHFLREVLALAETVTVLRDGRVVAELATAEASEGSLVEAMLGRPLTAAFPAKQLPAADAPLVLSVRGLAARGVDRRVGRGSRRGDRGPRRARRRGSHRACPGDLRRRPGHRR